MSNPKDDFIEHLYQLERKVDAISNHPQLGNSSVHGQRIDFYDRDNNRLGSLGGDNGLGFDYEDGPEPPRPAPPVVTADAGVIAVEWAGQWADGQAPSVSDPDVSRTRDLEGVEIHVSRDPLFEPDVVSMQGMFTSPDGGSYAVGPVHEFGEYFVRLRARSRSGKVSAPSEMVAVEVAAALIDLQLAEMQVRTIEAQESADGKSRIFRGPTVPDPALGPFNPGDTWFNTADSNMPSQWDGEQWVSVADERVDALEQAQTDLQEQVENISVTAGGNTITRSAAQPGDAQGIEGDTWFVMLDGKVVEQWHHDGTGWLTSELASSVIADLHAGKITSGYIDSARIKAGSLVADTVLVPGSAGSTVIRDGAVTTEKIAVGAITAESGIIGSLDVGKVVAGELDGMFIKAGAITAEKIESGAVTATALSADAINGKTITGATVQTSSTYPRVAMDTQGFHAWDASGSNTFNIDQASGKVNITGDLTQRNPYGYLRVGPDIYSNLKESPGISFRRNGTKYSGDAGMYLTGGGYDGPEQLQLQSPSTRFTDGSFRGSLLELRAGSDGFALRRITASGNVGVWTSGQSGLGVQVAGAGDPIELLSYNSTMTLGSLTSAGAWNSKLDLLANGDLSLWAPGWRWSNYYSGTAAANVHMTSTGWFQRSSSSRKLKLVEEPIERLHESEGDYDDRLLSLQAKTWVDKTAAERLAEYQTAVATGAEPDADLSSIEPLRRIPGMIAEDVADAGLTEFVEYDEQGGVVGIMYDRLGVALIPVVARLRERIVALEAALAA